MACVNYLGLGLGEDREQGAGSEEEMMVKSAALDAEVAGQGGGWPNVLSFFLSFSLGAIRAKRRVLQGAQRRFLTTLPYFLFLSCLLIVCAIAAVLYSHPLILEFLEAFVFSSEYAAQIDSIDSQFRHEV